MVTVQVLMGVFVRVCSTEAQYTDLQSADINAYGSNSLSYADELCAKKKMCVLLLMLLCWKHSKPTKQNKLRQTQVNPLEKNHLLNFFVFFSWNQSTEHVLDIEVYLFVCFVLCTSGSFWIMLQKSVFSFLKWKNVYLLFSDLEEQFDLDKAGLK